MTKLEIPYYYIINTFFINQIAMNIWTTGSNEMEVAHICLFEEKTGKTLLQFNEKFQMHSFVWWKCDWKNCIDTILHEMWDEIWYSFLPQSFVKVIQNTKIVWWKICNGTIYTGYLPEGFEPLDIKWEGKSEFYDLADAPLDNFITWDGRAETEKNILFCHWVLRLQHLLKYRL